MNNLILRNHLKDILSVARELNVDTGIARDIYLNAIRHGEVPAGEDAAVRAGMGKLFPAEHWPPLKAQYDNQTDEEKAADLADYAEAVREHYGQKI